MRDGTAKGTTGFSRLLCHASLWFGLLFATPLFVALHMIGVRANDEDARSYAPEIAYLWGSEQDGQSRGRFVKLPKGFVGEIRAKGSTFRAVLIKGQLQYPAGAEEPLEPGSYFSSNGGFQHPLAAEQNEVIIYIRTDGNFEVKSRGR